MKIDKAISTKLLNICKNKNISVNKLASISCLTQGTVENLVNCNSKNPKLLTIVRVCDGLNLTLTEFFDDDMFLNIDRENL